MTYGRAWRKEVMVMAAADHSGPGTVRRAGRVPEPPLRAGPVRVYVPPPSSAASRTVEDDAARLAAVAELAARYLAGDWGWPW